jgi:hypothetical protein
MKLTCGVIALACVPAALAGNKVPYPREKVTEFVVDKLDVTTLPSAIRPKHEKAKKTFTDYGYVPRQLDDKEAIIETTSGGSQISIRVLQQESAGIYVCVAGSEKNANEKHVQRVLFLKMKDANGFLKSRETFKEFSSCPVIGGTDESAVGSY